MRQLGEGPLLLHWLLEGRHRAQGKPLLLHGGDILRVRWGRGARERRLWKMALSCIRECVLPGPDGYVPGQERVPRHWSPLGDL